MKWNKKIDYAINKQWKIAQFKYLTTPKKFFSKVFLVDQADKHQADLVDKAVQIRYDFSLTVRRGSRPKLDLTSEQKLDKVNTVPTKHRLLLDQSQILALIKEVLF